MKVKHILVVDDDPAVRNLIADYLGEHNFRVSVAADGQAMAQTLAEDPVDLIVLDISLVEEDGLSLIRELRATSDIPIIILTEQHCDPVDRVIGLELGADDCLIKPCSPRELLARIKAVLRRVAASRRPLTKADKQRAYRFAQWELDVQACRLLSSAGKPKSLTRGEYGLLMAFLRSPYKVLSRDQLLNSNHLHDEGVYDRSIDVQILRLRRKLEANPREPQLIQTKRGAGYIFAANVEVF